MKDIWKKVGEDEELYHENVKVATACKTASKDAVEFNISMTWTCIGGDVEQHKVMCNDATYAVRETIGLLPYCGNVGQTRKIEQKYMNILYVASYLSAISGVLFFFTLVWWVFNVDVSLSQIAIKWKYLYFSSAISFLLAVLIIFCVAVFSSTNEHLIHSRKDKIT